MGFVYVYDLPESVAVDANFVAHKQTVEIVMIFLHLNSFL